MIKTNSILQNLAYITFGFEILPLIFCIYFYKKINTKSLKVFFIYALTLAICTLLGVIAAYVIKSKGLYVGILRIYLVAEYAFFVVFLSRLFKRAIAKKIAVFSIIPFSAFSLLNFILNPDKINTYSFVVEALFFIILLIYFFYEKMNTVVMYPLYQSIAFWICVGMLFYFAGNFFYFLFINSNTDKVFMAQKKIVYSFVTIIKDILFGIAFFGTEVVEEETDGHIEIFTELNLDLDKYNL